MCRRHLLKQRLSLPPLDNDALEASRLTHCSRRDLYIDSQKCQVPSSDILDQEVLELPHGSDSGMFRGDCS